MLYSLWSCKNCTKIGKTQQGVSSLESKTQTLHVWNNYSKLALRYVMHCVIWYHLYNLKNVKNTHEGVLLCRLRYQASACNFTKINTLPCVFFTLILQMVPNRAKHLIMGFAKRSTLICVNF